MVWFLKRSTPTGPGILRTRQRRRRTSRSIEANEGFEMLMLTSFPLLIFSLLSVLALGSEFMILCLNSAQVKVSI